MFHLKNRPPRATSMHPANWASFRDSVTDNFRVINPKDFRVLT